MAVVRLDPNPTLFEIARPIPLISTTSQHEIISKVATEISIEHTYFHSVYLDPF